MSDSGMIYKGYSRIFVHDLDDVQRVYNILNEIDKDEMECYAPKNLVSVYDKSEPLVYNGKFDLDWTVFYRKCVISGIPVFVISSYEENS